ncbi:hypothetical protein ECC02_001944 [Trypanosoma cruzi]|uniref:Uncharacterized protein n=1 Tax=Trypanosoma cruzi TaxID=5693 RepID=A0A7J6YE18_TRYCR|nr:hypothetical protein ECC02_001944 [Trypanosoma cruzi]
MQEKGVGCNEESGSLLSPSTLTALRHTRLLPRSIPPSFALQSQLIGTEFCASLSAAMLELLQNTSSGLSPLDSNASKMVTDVNSPVTALLYDLSAHYGSHTLRRAASHPLGPCYTSRRRRLSNGQHDGRRQLWSLSAAHRMWCRRCGVYLLAGETKALLSTSRTSSFQIPGDVDDVNSSDMNELNEKHTATRGTYVCRRCMNNEWLSRGKKGCASTPPPKSSPSCGQLSEITDEKSPSKTPLHASDTTFGGSVEARLATIVGRTRRRKRNKRGSVVRTPAMAMRNTSTIPKATLRAVPKGSLARGKRSRSAASKEPAPRKKDRLAMNIRSTERDVSAVAPVRREARTEGSPSTSKVVSCAGRPEISTDESEVNAQFPTLPRGPPTKGRRHTFKKSGNCSRGNPPSNSFADTLSRLGL